MLETKKVSVRISIKTTHNIKSLLKSAANEAGLSLNAYILNHALQHAQNVLVIKNSITLTEVTWKSLNRAVNSPD